MSKKSTKNKPETFKRLAEVPLSFSSDNNLRKPAVRELIDIINKAEPDLSVSLLDKGEKNWVLRIDLKVEEDD